MGVTLQIQRVEILNCDGRRRGVQLALLRVAAKCLDDLDIGQVRYVQPQRRVGNPLGDRLS
jgi:hypothetical protein